MAEITSEEFFEEWVKAGRPKRFKLRIGRRKILRKRKEYETRSFSELLEDCKKAEAQLMEQIKDWGDISTL